MLPDEALPRQFVQFLSEHGCPAEASPRRWKGKKNGELIEVLKAEGGAVLVTCDRNTASQQSFRGRRVALVVLPGQRLRVLAGLAEATAAAVRKAELGTVTVLDLSGSIISPGP